MAGEPKYLTYWEAAHRVGRSKRAIQRWRKNGMPMTMNQAGERIVEERVLLAWYRDRLRAWPPHIYRMRRLRNEVEPNG